MKMDLNEVDKEALRAFADTGELSSDLFNVVADMAEIVEARFDEISSKSSMISFHACDYIQFDYNSIVGVNRDYTYGDTKEEIPHELLLSDDYVEKLLEAQREKEKKEAELRVRTAAHQKKRADEADLKEYERLKAKFGG